MHGTIPIRQTYKTPTELGFTQVEFDALAWFVDEFDAGRIPDAEVDVDHDFSGHARCANTIKPPDAFYMPYVYTKSVCGTAGCIFGWVAHRTSHVRIAHWPFPIQILFSEHSDEIKAADARDATVRVLRGEPAWL